MYGAVWSSAGVLRADGGGDEDASAYSVMIPFEALAGPVRPGDIVALGERDDEIRDGFTASDLLEGLRPDAFAARSVTKHAGDGIRGGYVDVG